MGTLHPHTFARMQRRLCRYGKRQMAGFYCCHKCMKYHKIHRKKYLISYFASGEPCIRILLRACGAAANLPGKSSLIGHTARNAPSRDAQARSSRISAKASVGRAIHPRFHLFPETVTPPCGVLPLANASDLISTWKKQPHRAHGAQRAITRRASALLSYLHQGKRRAGDSPPFSPPSGVSGSGHAPCGEWLRTKAGRSSCGRRRPKSLLRSKARRTHSRP